MKGERVAAPARNRPQLGARQQRVAEYDTPRGNPISPQFSAATLMASPQINRNSASGALNDDSRSPRTRNAAKADAGAVARRRNTLQQYLDSRAQENSLSLLDRIEKYKDRILQSHKPN